MKTPQKAAADIHCQISEILEEVENSSELKLDVTSIKNLLEGVALEHHFAREAELVGIRLFFNKKFEYITTDNKTQIVEKAIDFIEPRLKYHRVLKQPQWSTISDLYPKLKKMLPVLEQPMAYSKLRQLRLEYLNLVLDTLARLEGLDYVTKDHPLWTSLCRSISVTTSLEHYHKAHRMTKKYGFRNCGIFMSYALGEYYEHCVLPSIVFCNIKPLHQQPIALPTTYLE